MKGKSPSWPMEIYHKYDLVFIKSQVQGRKELYFYSRIE